MALTKTVRHQYLHCESYGTVYTEKTLIYVSFESVVTSSEGADLSEDLKNGTPRGSLAFAFIKKIHWWYGIVWVGLASWVVVRWGFEGY